LLKASIYLHFTVVARGSRKQIVGAALPYYK